jgi:acetoin utilization protein AcuB
MVRQQHVCDYMTVSPHSVDLEQSLATAARRMRELRTRHLPVVHGEELKGIISQRDVALAQAVGLDPNELSVEEAMVPEPFTVSPDTPLSEVARAMASHKYGCAVVAEGGQVRGIFTTVDALRALAELLDERCVDDETLKPSQVREMMLAEHQTLKRLLDQAEARAQDILDGRRPSDAEVRALRDAARQLYTSLASHNALEDRVLGAVLRTTDAWGPLRVERMTSVHRDQQRALESALMELDDLSQPARALAEQVLAIASTVRADVQAEEEELLCPELLRDDTIIENPEAD